MAKTITAWVFAVKLRSGRYTAESVKGTKDDATHCIDDLTKAGYRCGAPVRVELPMPEEEKE